MFFPLSYLAQLRPLLLACSHNNHLDVIALLARTVISAGAANASVRQASGELHVGK
jgi:hypothetical protein